MIPTAVKAWLAKHYSEPEMKKIVGGSRQNWSQRRPKLRVASGVKLAEDTWIYRRESADTYLADTEKHRPY